MKLCPIHRAAFCSMSGSPQTLSSVLLRLSFCFFLVLHRRCRPAEDETVPHSSSGFLLDEWDRMNFVQAFIINHLRFCFFLGADGRLPRKSELVQSFLKAIPQLLCPEASAPPVEARAAPGPSRPATGKAIRSRLQRIPSQRSTIIVWDPSTQIAFPAGESRMNGRQNS